jgi:hypothetical protein
MESMMARLAPVAALALLAAAGGLAAGPARWTAEQARKWYAGRPWMVGCNYVPSNAVNSVEMWQAGTFDEALLDRELAWAQGLGFNTVRVFLQYAVWKEDPAGFLKRFDRFLEVADSHGISVMPVLFDDCAFGDLKDPVTGPQGEPVPGVHNSRWVPSPGHGAVADRTAWPSIEKYVKAVVGAHAKDKRVCVWDLYNEPGNAGMGDASIPLMEAAFRWARESKPTQPLTVATWGGAPAAADATALELSDVVSFHFYGDRSGMAAEIARAKKHKRPVICTEWMARTMGASFETDLPLLKDENVGAISWGLVEGRTQTRFPWGSPAGAAEPSVWFHNILRGDGSPWDLYEALAIRMTTGAYGINRLTPAFNYPLRDTCICLGPDGTYYMTGTTGAPTWWETNPGIRLFKSKDLVSWEPMGLVWSFEKDTTWQKKNDRGQQAIWAPEIHYIKGTYWIAYCMNYGGTGILKSVSGRPEGPYVDVKPDGPLMDEIDASLFQDDDGSVYFVYQNGKIARMKDDMSGLAEEPLLLKPEGSAQVGFEGAFIFKKDGRYYLSCADFVGGGYHGYVASAPSLKGPYGPRYLAVPHGGHNMYFRDKAGAWWCTFFGSDHAAPFQERPGLMPVTFGLDREPRPLPIGKP